MNSINTNMSALNAQQNINKQNQEMNDAMTRLSSGLRINSAADDAAGSAISSKMETQVRSLNMAIRNSYDAISMTQTAEGALSEMENVLQRVRELSVQAGNSTLSSSDRTSIQKEVDALVSELNSISSKTNFNGVKLLDGSRNSITFQTGIDATDSLNVNLQKSDSVSLGLDGGSSVSTFTSGRVSATDYSSTNLAVDAIKINGENMISGSAAYSVDLSSSGADAARLLAVQINTNTSVHGSKATAYNELTSNQKATYVQSAIFAINGDDVAVASDLASLVATINRDVSGVTAVLNDNDTIKLSNNTGDDIVFSAGSGSLQGAVDVGLIASTSDTDYRGYIKLENTDGSTVKIEAGTIQNGYSSDTGTISDVQALGFNEINNDYSVSTGTVSSSAFTTSTDLKINDVAIGVSVSASAASKAIAINAKTSETGVTATADNRVELTLDFDNVPTAATKTFDLSTASSGVQVFRDGTNTYQATFSTDADTTVGLLVTAINNGSNTYTASQDGTNLIITAGSSGNNSPDFDTGLTFQMRLDNVAEVDTVTLNAATDAKYSAIEVSDGTNTATVIQTTADAGGDFDQLKTKIAAITDFSSDVVITESSSTSTDGDILFTAAEAGKAIQGTYTVNQLVASSVAVSGTASDYETHTQVGSSIQKDVFTVLLDSGNVDGTNDLETTFATNGGVVELTFTSSEGTGTIYQEMDSTAGTAGTTVTLVTALAAKINARSDFAFSAGVDANGDLQLTANANGSGILTTDTVTLALYSWAADDIETHADTTANTTGSTESSTDTSSASSSTIQINGANISISSTDEMTNVVSTINSSGLGDIVASVEETTGNLVLSSVSGADIKITDSQAQSIVASMSDVTSTAQTLTVAALTTGITNRGQIHLSNSDGSLIKLSGDNLSELGAKAQSSTSDVQSASLSVSTIADANSALSSIDSAIAKVSAFRSSFGAVENRIDASINNLTTLKLNTEAAKSRIEDADFAAETSKLTKSQILAQAATSMLAQANASKQNLLALLQG
jgi:flagellin